MNLTIAARPVISSLNPSAVTAGGPGFTLTVNGSGFGAGAVVQWNGSGLATNFVSAAQLMASVPASLIASAGTAAVTVVSGGVTSNAVNLTIAAGPAISLLNPSTVTAGGPGFTLAVNGSGFSTGAVVQWNGSALATNFVSTAQLTASVPAALIANPGTATVTVVSGGVASNPVNLTIGPLLIPSVDIQGLPESLNPAEQVSLRIVLSGQFATPVSGRLTLRFESDAADGVDPPMNVVLENGSRTYDFIYADKDGPDVTVRMLTGTLAGRITLSITLLRTGQNTIDPPMTVERSAAVRRVPPTILRACLTRTTSGFDAVVIGFSTIREVRVATFRFTGDNLLTTELSPPGIQEIFDRWYKSAGSLEYGSQFKYVQPFFVQGDVNAVRSALITLTNQAGISESRSASFEEGCAN